MIQVKTSCSTVSNETLLCVVAGDAWRKKHRRRVWYRLQSRPGKGAACAPRSMTNQQGVANYQHATKQLWLTERQWPASDGWNAPERRGSLVFHLNRCEMRLNDAVRSKMSWQTASCSVPFKVLVDFRIVKTEVIVCSIFSLWSESQEQYADNIQYNTGMQAVIVHCFPSCIKYLTSPFFPISSPLLPPQDFQLEAQDVYVRAGQRLVRQRQFAAMRQLLKCVGESGTATKNDCDGLILSCVSVADKGPADVSTKRW